jgi:hypothetical protein
MARCRSWTRKDTAANRWYHGYENEMESESHAFVIRLYLLQGTASCGTGHSNAKTYLTHTIKVVKAKAKNIVVAAILPTT